MIEDNPRMNELEEMVRFIGRDKKVYIYQHDLMQRLISKYLYMSGIPIQGFIKPEVCEADTVNEYFPVISLAHLQALGDKEDIRIIVASDDSLYNQIIEMFRVFGIDRLYFVSNWNKRTIAKKMLPRETGDFLLEVNLADHCNLNCQCCDHFSPIADKTFLDYDQYVKDITRLAELTGGRIGLMKLQGGEPLLNERLIDFLKVTREVFSDTYICIFTDGLLLSKWGEKEGDENIWTAIKQYECEIRLTRYSIPLNLDIIVKQAEQNDIPIYYDAPPYEKRARLWILSEIGAKEYRGVKRSVKHPFELQGTVDKYRWISCYQFNESIVLRDGKIYTCPMIPYVHYFNKKFDQNLEVKEDCYIDIYKAHSYLEIAEFCTHRTSFCDYCAVHMRNVMDWKQSEHTMEEWVL